MYTNHPMLSEAMADLRQDLFHRTHGIALAACSNAAGSRAASPPSSALAWGSARLRAMRGQRCASHLSEVST
jgi:hypothetical protein